jgi:predicted GNAT superfamily acetyltransferase
VILRDAASADFPAIVALNAASVEHTGAMDEARLAELAALACYLRVIAADGAVAAFLLGFREGAPYDSPNYRWLCERLGRFHYIDRVVVAEGCRGQGLADRLYDDFERVARAAGAPRLACEVNVDPPNPRSLRFHARRGFAEIGRLSAAKTVAFLVRPLG